MNGISVEELFFSSKTNRLPHHVPEYSKDSKMFIKPTARPGPVLNNRRVVFQSTVYTENVHD